MKVEFIKKETIKPSFPTPPHLKTHTISLLDQIACSIYVNVILAYPAPNDINSDDAHAGRRRYDHFSQTLKNSLSPTLTIFPPLAGRFKDNVSVACSDEGVLCYETRVHSTLDTLLLNVGDEGMESLFVVGDDDDVNADTGAQLLVQINLFDCGGIALGLSFSHKLCDFTTFATFLKSWSGKAINSGLVVVPDFTVATKIRPRKEIDGSWPMKYRPTNHELSTVRLVYDGPKIAALKAISASQSTPQPTRVEAVTALIGKCAMTASKTNNMSYSMPFLFMHLVNMRAKLIPSLPETTFGNVVGNYMACNENSNASLDVLVDMLRKGRMDYYDSLALDGEKVIHDIVEMMETVGTGSFPPRDMEFYQFTSWCRSGFYELDFGLGKPKWAGTPFVTSSKNRTLLMDADGGNNAVEAQVTLTKQDMALFLADPILLGYASVNPAI